MMDTASTLTNGDFHINEVRPGDPPHVVALKQEWLQIANREQAKAEEVDKAVSVTRQWDGRARSARHQMMLLRGQREKIESALRSLL